VDLGFAGRAPSKDAIHRLISDLRVGDELWVKGRELRTSKDKVVGKLSAKATLAAPFAKGKITGVMVRTKAKTDSKYSDSLRSDAWEVVLAELVIDVSASPKSL
jgi:hypothetical protein